MAKRVIRGDVCSNSTDKKHEVGEASMENGDVIVTCIACGHTAKVMGLRWHDHVVVGTSSALSVTLSN